VRSLISVSLLAISLSVFGVESAHAQLKINPYPVQEASAAGRVASSDQLDPAVVRALLARQKAADAGVVSSAPVSSPVVPAVSSSLLPTEAEYMEPVAPKPVAANAPVMQGVAPVRDVVARAPSSIPALDRVTVVVHSPDAPEFIAPRVSAATPVPLAAQSTAPALSTPVAPAVAAPVEMAAPVYKSPMMPAPNEVVLRDPSAPVVDAPAVSPVLEAQRDIFKVYASDPALLENPAVASALTGEVPARAKVETVVPMAALSSAASEPMVKQDIDYSALARQQLGMDAPIDAVDVAASDAAAARGGLSAHKVDLVNVTQMPVALYKGADTDGATQAALPVASVPVTAEALVPQEMDVTPTVPPAAVSTPTSAPVVPKQVVTRADMLEPVKAHVADLDQAASSVPAQIQEEAMLRGLQMQGGSIVPDPLEGRVIDTVATMDKATGGGEIVQPVDYSTAREAGVPTKTAEELLNEADGILNNSIENSTVSKRERVAMAEPVSAAESLRMPSEELLADPLASQDDGNKVVYNEDNVRSVMQNAEGTESALPEMNVAHVDAVPPGGKPRSSSGAWSADAGESAYQVLKEWSDRAGVDLIWDSQFLVNVRDGLSVDGGYEEAVAALLEQYSGLYAGVEGTLYLDDRSGRRVLHIQTSGQG